MLTHGGSEQSRDQRERSTVIEGMDSKCLAVAAATALTTTSAPISNPTLRQTDGLWLDPPECVARCCSAGAVWRESPQYRPHSDPSGRRVHRRLGKCTKGVRRVWCGQTRSSNRRAAGHPVLRRRRTSLSCLGCMAAGENGVFRIMFGNRVAVCASERKRAENEAGKFSLPAGGKPDFASPPRPQLLPVRCPSPGTPCAASDRRHCRPVRAPASRLV
jgi:hypothetical protein